MSSHWRRLIPVLVAGSLVPLFVVGSLVAGSVHAQPRALAGPIFSDGFESGNLSNWTTATAGFVAQQQVVFDGTWAGRATTSRAAADVYKALPSAQSDLYADVHVQLVAAGGTVHVLRFLTATGTSIVGLAMKRSGQLILRDFTTSTSVTSTTKAAPGSWHDLQLHATINGAASTAEVWLDGAKVTPLSGTYSLGSAPVGRLMLGTPVSSSGFDMALDDAIADTTFIGGPGSPDTTPPTVPTGLTATKVGAFSVDLGWNTSTDDTRVAGYTVNRDGTRIGTSPSATYSDGTVSPSTTYSYTVDAYDAAGHHSGLSDPLSVTTSSQPSLSTPIQHVIIIDQENHSFDDTLGKLCADIAAGTVTGHQPCDGATQGTLSTGGVIPLAQEPDVVPNVSHGIAAQQTAIDGGKMDGFDHVSGCGSTTGYACYAQYDPSQIPNLAALATKYAISDRTFEFASTPSWGGHLVLASATLDGFDGGNPRPSTSTTQSGHGWGCDSFNDANWWNGSRYVLEPSCVPDKGGHGPYRASPVPYVPTIFDRLDAAGFTWKIYGGAQTSSGYGWTICPSFYECLGSSQRKNLIDAANVVADAKAGTLPNFSIVTPTGPNSQHNTDSMALGDNWIGQVVGAIQQGREWSSTAIFITYDDCGCFYDHVPPPSSGTGIRVPMVIASPYVKAGYTDSHEATFLSMLAYAEHVFGVPALGSSDGGAYDYADAFDYTQTPLSGIATVQTPISRSERAWLAAHPPSERDPT